LIVTNGGGAGVLAVDDLIQTDGRLAPLTDLSRARSSAAATGRRFNRSTSWRRQTGLCRRWT
jgi:hypothetical protein